MKYWKVIPIAVVVFVSSFLVSIIPVDRVVHAQTGNGVATPFFSAAVTSAANVTGAKTLYGWNLVNPNGSACWLQVFNIPAASVTLGTTAPLFSIQVAATSSNSQAAGAMGLAFSGGGFSVAGTTTSNGASTCATGMGTTIFFQ